MGLGGRPNLNPLATYIQRCRFLESSLSGLCGSAGSAVIDVGCGVLGVLHLLVERVGVDGRVVGVDREGGWWSLAASSPNDRNWPSSS
jgi:ubiquinone/menaquinone biosynthesis C-methylase UbiE